MNNQDELNLSQQQLEQEDILLSGDSVLASLGIDSSQVKSIKPRWKRTHYRAIVNWITKYQPDLDASNLQRVRGYLEAFHHFGAIDEWENAKDILSIPVNNSSQESLHLQLGIWGYYQEQIHLYRQSLGKLKDMPGYLWDSFCFSGMGNSYLALGNLEKALHNHQQHFALASIQKDIGSQGIALGNLGLVYDLLGDYSMAIEFHQKGLKIAQAYGYKSREGETLGHLGSVYYSLGDVNRAIELYLNSY